MAVRIAIVGQGYVGVSVGVAAYEAGHDVVGIEIDAKRISELSHINYFVTSNFSHIKNAEIVIIAVPTPLDSNLDPDISFLESACSLIKPHLSSGTLIINESTSYPGTLREVISELLGNGFEYAVAPERVDPDNTIWNVKNTPRVVGALSETALRRSVNFYKSFCKDIIEVSSPEVAEAAKLFENTFRQVNIALVNEFAQIAYKLGISASETLRAANTKPFGFMKFLPSIGVGGHCIPVDPTYLSFAASRVGVEAEFIELANKLNRQMPRIIADRIDKQFCVAGKKLQIAGLSYKANTVDLRESPSLPLISELRSRGAEVIWHDPLVHEHNGEFSSPIVKVDLGIICVSHAGVNYSEWEQTQTRVLDLSISENLKFPKFF